MFNSFIYKSLNMWLFFHSVNSKYKSQNIRNIFHWRNIKITKHNKDFKYYKNKNIMFILYYIHTSFLLQGKYTVLSKKKKLMTKKRHQLHVFTIENAIDCAFDKSATRKKFHFSFAHFVPTMSDWKINPQVYNGRYMGMLWPQDVKPLSVENPERQWLDCVKPTKIN